MANAPNTRRVLTDPFVWIAIALLVSIVACVVWIFVVVSRKLPENPDDPFLLVYFAARLMQVTLGMLIGTAAMLLGVVIAWFGIMQETNLSVESSPFKARLVSATPGAFLVLCGTAIVLLCLWLPLKIEHVSCPEGTVNHGPHPVNRQRAP